MPESFDWHGRRYLVRGVVDHWRQRRAWWRLATEIDEPGRGEEPSVFDPASMEEEVWRVEAAPDPAGHGGIYDLAHGSRWRLLRVAD